MCTLHTRFCTFCADLYAQSVLSNLTTFLHRSSVGSLSRVRCWLGTHRAAGDIEGKYTGRRGEEVKHTHSGLGVADDGGCTIF